jgi:hypothetical protein
VKAIFALLGAMLATACAPVVIPPASDRLVEQARSLSPPAGHAGVYVIRGGSHLAEQPLWTVDLDFHGFGTVRRESYLYGTNRRDEQTGRTLVLQYTLSGDNRFEFAP